MGLGVIFPSGLRMVSPITYSEPLEFDLPKGPGCTSIRLLTRRLENQSQNFFNTSGPIVETSEGILV